MDILSRILKPGKNGAAKVDPTKSWPHSFAQDDRYYGFTDAHGSQLVAMTRRTWEALGTIIEQQKRTMAAQDTTIKAQSAEIARLTASNVDAMEKLNNLRGNHRELLRKNAMADLGPPPVDELPALDLFATPKKGK